MSPCPVRSKLGSDVHRNPGLTSGHAHFHGRVWRWFVLVLLIRAGAVFFFNFFLPMTSFSAAGFQRESSVNKLFCCGEIYFGS